MALTSVRLTSLRRLPFPSSKLTSLRLFSSCPSSLLRSTPPPIPNPLQPLLSLVNQHLSLLSSSPFFPTPPSLFEQTELEKDPRTKELFEWANLKDQEQGGFRSIEITKVQEGDGEWRTEVYARSDSSADPELQKGKLIAKASSKDQNDSLAQAATAALEYVKSVEGQKKLEDTKDEQKVDESKPVEQKAKWEL